MGSAQFCRVIICSLFLFTLWGQVWSQRRRCGRHSFPQKGEGYRKRREDAEPGAFPWMVAIEKLNDEGNPEFKCSGFLIDTIHVISAAHCFEENQTSLYSAKIGNANLAMGESYTFSSIAVHDGYRQGQFDHDIALLTLSREVDDPGFNPVCLPPRKSLLNLTGKGTTVVGWENSTYSDESAGPMLKQLSGLFVLSNDVCSQAYSSWFSSSLPQGITSAMICAGSGNHAIGKVDSCKAPGSGGPLMIQVMNRWYVVGVASFGLSCNEFDFPSVHTRVSTYKSWIEKQKG